MRAAQRACKGGLYLVEYSLDQLMAVCSSIIEFCNKSKMTDKQLDFLRIRLNDPTPKGEISFDIGLPKGVIHPMQNDFA